MEKLGAQGVPCGAVMDTKELSDEPSMREREIFAEIDHPVRGKLVIPGWPVKMSGQLRARWKRRRCSAPTTRTSTASGWA